VLQRKAVASRMALTVLRGHALNAKRSWVPVLAFPGLYKFMYCTTHNVRWFPERPRLGTMGIDIGTPDCRRHLQHVRLPHEYGDVVQW
jgi:hypothetical protein